jgi:hypothetical protein
LKRPSESSKVQSAEGFVRKKLTPLQSLSLKERGTTVTTLREELDAGFRAYGIVRAKNDPQLLRLVSAYAILGAQSMLAQGNASQSTIKKKEFLKISNKLFAQAKKSDVFTDTKVLAGALLQALEYLIQNPNGELRDTAIKLIQSLDGSTPLGNPTSSSRNYNSVLYLVLFYFIYQLVTGRSVR